MESKTIKIIAIDDNPNNLMILKAFVADVLPDAVIFTTTDGYLGIEMIRSENPDVILLDIIMPGLDGFEVCRIIKADKDMQLIPVLFLTAMQTSRELRIKAIDAGAEAFLAKPFDEIELMAQIQAMVKIKERNTLIQNQNDRLEYLIGKRTQKLVNEIAHRKSIESELRRKEEQYRLLVENQTDLIVKTDRKGNFIYISPSFCRKFDQIEEGTIGKPYNMLVHPDDLVLIQNSVAQLLEPPHTNISENRWMTPDGWRWIEWTTRAEQDDNGEIIGFLGTGRDITVRKEDEQKIRHMNYHDLLTGLYNRRYAAEAQQRFDLPEYLPLSLIIGDINGLKLINDTLGHSEGDRLLIETSAILSGCVDEKHVIARTGGDEFTILMPHTDSDEAQRIMEAIYTACKAFNMKQDKSALFLSISLGYGTKNSMDEPMSGAIKKAEDFMYKRKLLEHKSFHSSLINSIRTTLFEKSHETEQHAARLVELSKKLGRMIGLDEERMSELDLLCTLHDIGKISIEERILTKAEKLTDEEWHEIKKHPGTGYRIAMSSLELVPIADYILSHHERWDGKGYPRSLKGEEIPLLSRILAVVDTFDAMTEDRPYRHALPVEESLNEIERNAGTQFDPVIANLFVKLMRSR